MSMLWLRSRLRSLPAISLLSVLGLALLPQVVMRLLGWPHVLWDIQAWLLARRVSNHDSWLPISNALKYVAEHGGAGLYEANYYQSANQIIYPPTSLVFATLTGLPGLFDWHSAASMNLVSWWLVPIMMATIAVIELTGLARQGIRISIWDVSLAVLLGVVSIPLFYPIILSLTVGQIQTWLDLLVMLALLAWVLGHKTAAGIAIGLVCVIKPTLGILVIWAALRREWRFTAALAITGVSFALASIAMYGWQVHKEYLQLLGFLSRRGDSLWINQSMNGFLNRILFIGNNLEWDPTHTLTPYDPRVHFLTMASTVLLVGIVLFYRRRNTPGPLDLGFAVTAVTLASPVAYFTHLGFLPAVFLLALLAAHVLPTIRRSTYLLMGISYMLCTDMCTEMNNFAPTYLNFLQSYFMFGVLLLLAVLVRINNMTERHDMGDLNRARNGVADAQPHHVGKEAGEPSLNSRRQGTPPALSRRV